VHFHNIGPCYPKAAAKLKLTTKFNFQGQTAASAKGALR
jgi:hypothetical protein